MELTKYSPIQSDHLMKMMEERKTRREHFQLVAQTLDEMVEHVSDSITSQSSLSPSVDLKAMKSIEQPSRSISDSLDLLINQLCDHPEIREIRLTLQNRYQRLFKEVEEKIQRILLEHQSNSID